MIFSHVFPGKTLTQQRSIDEAKIQTHQNCSSVCALSYLILNRRTGCSPILNSFNCMNFLIFWSFGLKNLHIFSARAVESFLKREQDVTMNVWQDVTMDVYQLSAVLLAVYTVFAYCVYHSGKSCSSFKLIEALWARLQKTNPKLSLLIFRMKTMQI